jgi:hypothetical protein
LVLATKIFAWMVIFEKVIVRAKGVERGKNKDKG